MKNKKPRHPLVNKIGFCKNEFLGIDKTGGHYVYIRETNGKKCKVNIVTSLENEKHEFTTNKLHKIKHGLIYPVPKRQSTFNRWPAIDLTTKTVDISDISNIGKRHI